MKYCRFMYGGLTHYGRVEEHGGSLRSPPLPMRPRKIWDAGWSRWALQIWRCWAGLEFEPMPLSAADLLPPVTPSKIVCVGRNYRDHVKELGNEMPAEPLLFFKPPSSLLRPGGVVRMPAVSERVDFEGELALVIGRRAHKLKPEAIGATWCADTRWPTTSPRATCKRRTAVDARQGLRHVLPGRAAGERRSSTSMPALTLETRVNGEVRQQASTQDFIFSDSRSSRLHHCGDYA